MSFGPLYLIVVYGAAAVGFGEWMGSFGAGLWMLMVLLWAEGFSENVKRR